MMNGAYGGMSAGAWVLMAVLWVALIVAIVWAVASLVSRGRSGGESPDLAERPQDVLDRRLASGELDVPAYDVLRAKLRDAHGAQG